MAAEPVKRLVLKVSGIVQGVGFRPRVYSLATSLSLSGYVTNTDSGVLIEVEGQAASEFPKRLMASLPPLARVTEMDVQEAAPLQEESGFRILQSREGRGFTFISPDVSVCDACQQELRDPDDRRHNYPFINCTDCGPRYTITLRTPYDRANTTMSRFRMCPACEAEYEDPGSRRFHAEPNACPECGPSLEFVLADGTGKVRGTEALEAAISILKQGSIVAIKGLGGFHLACDATKGEAVERLRLLKRKSNKPFALMARDMDVIRRYCHVSEEEAGMLESARRPVVLLRKREPQVLPAALAPGNRDLGFMLPYTPLHALIMDRVEVAVMTSGNLAEEPIQYDNEQARVALGQMCDALLLHDREIFMRVDDSVVRMAGAGTVSYIRRSRGFAPEPIGLSSDGLEVLGVGADLKNTFTLMKGRSAIVSQHLGDMGSAETLAFFEETLANLKQVYRAKPVALAYDMHPGYMSTQWALRQEGVALVAVQHHHAHIASVMCEKGLRRKVIGVALDGTGYGPDGTLWGGEFLVCDAREYKRVAHFAHIALPGGERAIREPWRTAVSAVGAAYGQEALGVLEALGFASRYGGLKALDDVLRVSRMAEYSPISSGAGRLFDAAAAIVGLCGHNTYEGEAGLALEAAASLARGDAGGAYAHDIYGRSPMVVDFTFTLLGMVKDLGAGVAREVVALRFHGAVAEAVVRVVGKLSREHGVRDVVLSGGVFQNMVLIGLVRAGLVGAGMTVHVNEVVPPNDGGISLGQAYIARFRS